MTRLKLKAKVRSKAELIEVLGVQFYKSSSKLGEYVYFTPVENTVCDRSDRLNITQCLLERSEFNGYWLSIHHDTDSYTILLRNPHINTQTTLEKELAFEAQYDQELLNTLFEVI